MSVDEKAYQAVLELAHKQPDDESTPRWTPRRVIEAYEAARATPTAQQPTGLPQRLRTKAAMIEMGEGMTFGSDTAASASGPCRSPRRS